MTFRAALDDLKATGWQDALQIIYAADRLTRSLDTLDRCQVQLAKARGLLPASYNETAMPDDFTSEVLAAIRESLTAVRTAKLRVELARRHYTLVRHDLPTSSLTGAGPDAVTPASLAPASSLSPPGDAALANPVPLAGTAALVPDASD